MAFLLNSNKGYGGIGTVRQNDVVRVWILSIGAEDHSKDENGKLVMDSQTTHFGSSDIEGKFVFIPRAFKKSKPDAQK